MDPAQQRRLVARQNGRRRRRPELIVDFEAENALLRAALANAEGAGKRRDLVTDELKHRLSNVLAVVNAMARQTFKDFPGAVVDDFGARLHALAAAQKILIDSETRIATLLEVVTSALAPYCEVGDRCTVSGPDVPLDGRRGHALTLALHELATNAAKYGALSVEGGWVEIVWTCADNEIDFLWQEHGGPPVTAPARKGFGTSLITRNLGVAFSGKVDLHFPAEGVECRLSAPA